MPKTPSTEPGEHVFRRPPGPGEEDVRAFMLQEYQSYRDALDESEKLGEGRVNLFLTVATAAAGAIAVARKEVPASAERTGPVVYVLLAAVLLFGITTLGRMIRRNVTTDEMKDALGRMREYFRGGDPRIERYLTWPSGKAPPREPPAPTDLLAPTRGGLVETVALVNSLVVAALSWFLATQLGSWAAGGGGGRSALVVVGILGAVAGFLATWLAQLRWIGRRYHEAERERDDRWAEWEQGG